jgi:HPt (histidine-containing phosphotransfer) domain-containing protein
MLKPTTMSSFRGDPLNPPNTIFSQEELGDEFALGPISVISELDPTGENGVVKDVLEMFGASLDPMLTLVEGHLQNGSSYGIRFEAHKLHSAAAQMGAMKLAAACAGITRHFAAQGYLTHPEMLTALVHVLMVEAVHVQRRLARLLAH